MGAVENSSYTQVWRKERRMGPGVRRSRSENTGTTATLPTRTTPARNAEATGTSITASVFSATTDAAVPELFTTRIL